MSLAEPINQAETAEEWAATRARLEGKTIEELFAASLEGEYDDNAPWAAVSLLRLRGTSEVFDVARNWCQSENPKARARGIDVLAQLGAGRADEQRPFMAESVSIAINRLGDTSPLVVHSAAWALSHLGTETAVDALIGLKNHVDPGIRQAVACCIPLRRHSQAVPILIALMEDEEPEVRDWATFSLAAGDFGIDGVFRYSDSREIRSALHKRLSDAYEDARREAIWGLATRKDPVGLK